jgi:hypothetical protein
VRGVRQTFEVQAMGKVQGRATKKGNATPNMEVIIVARNHNQKNFSTCAHPIRAGGLSSKHVQRMPQHVWVMIHVIDHRVWNSDVHGFIIPVTAKINHRLLSNSSHYLKGILNHDDQSKGCLETNLTR